MSLDLNAESVAAINAAGGGWFSIGGSLLSIGRNRDYLFGSSAGRGTQLLVVVLG